MTATIENLNKKVDDLYEKNNAYYSIIKKLEEDNTNSQKKIEELNCEAMKLKHAMDCYDIDPDDEHLVTFPHPKASFTSTRTKELNRLSAPSYLNNTQHSKKKKKVSQNKVTSMLSTQQQPPATIKSTTNKFQHNGHGGEKMRSHDKKVATGVSPGQYFSNSVSVGNTNGYYIKNSVRE